VDPEKRSATLHSFACLLPDLVNTILNLYSRAWTFTDEKLSPLSFLTSTIRFAKLLTTVHDSQGHLGETSLKNIVLNMKLSYDGGPTSAKIDVKLLKSDIVTLLFRAYPDSSVGTSLSMSDHITILAATASMLSQLGYHRKKALVLKDTLTALLPALVQARKDGAAEMGVHPAASLASLHTVNGASVKQLSGSGVSDSEHGMQDFLSLICEAYGIRPRNTDRIHEEDSSGESSAITSAIGSSVSAAMRQAAMSAHGAHEMKNDILRSCINTCEALPDLHGALQYSADLLRTAGSGIAPGHESSNGSPTLPVEEQVRLANNISRTLSAAQHLGLEPPEADYWDEFLVRGIEVVDVSVAKALVSHARTELEIVETIDAKKEQNPFIYNPFLKATAASVAETLLVANEEAVFRVVLQNLYDFDVTVERIRLKCEGMVLECPLQSTMIGPYRTQTMLLTGIPRSSGPFTIHGCTAKIKGCRERDFFTFSEPWVLVTDVKGRNVTLNGRPGKERPISTASDSGKSRPIVVQPGPKPTPLQLSVISSQPNVVLKSISLPQSAIMLLEGETKTFTITLRNTSKRTSVDLLLLSFIDPITTHAQSAMASKELSATELYELEVISSRKQSFQWSRRSDQHDLSISPGSEMTLDIKVLGMAGLSYSTIQIDYGHLGKPKSDMENRFYTRQLVVPVTVTVNGSINLIHNDLMPLSEDASWHHDRNQLQDSQSSKVVAVPPKDTATFLSRIGVSPDNPSKCLLLLDFHNSWSNTLLLTLKILPSTSLDLDPRIHSNTHSLHPYTSTRIPIPLLQIYLPDSAAHASVPSLNPASRRQFIVSATKNTAEAERGTREAFWYREELLKCLTAQWREESTGRVGDIDMRTLRLTMRMINAFKLDEVEITMSVSKSEMDFEDEDSGEVRQVGKEKYHVPTSTFLSLHTTLLNRSSQAIYPLLRLQPSIADQPHTVALDLGKKLLINGVLQRALPVLEPNKTVRAETGFCVLSSGIYEWGASVEELKVAHKSNSREGGESKGRKRAQTGELDLMQDQRRRSWYADRACTIIARGTTS